MKIEGILLDLDNTVYDYSAAHDPALAAALDWLSQKLGQSAEETEKAYAASRRHVNKCLHGLAACHSRILYFQGVCEAFGQWPCEIAMQAEDLYWATFLPKMQVRQDCIAFLNAMQPRPMAIVTDLTARIQFEKVTRLGLKSHVKAIVTSEEVGHEKPHPDIFAMAAQKLALKPQQLCMIGDSWERDIEGALSMGIQCFWFCEGQDETLPPVASQSSQVGQSSQSGTVSVAKFTQFSDLIKMVHACG
jgi:putative hydrolase of the HAD superfamily